MKDCILEVKSASKFIAKHSGLNIHLLDKINLKIKFTGNSKLVSILAPSGAGKSILLKIISGIEKPDEGTVVLNGSEYKKPSGEIAFIPEEPSSFPWLSVRQNVEFTANLKKENIDIQKLIDLVGLTGYENHYPNERSTGFRFRISVARALAVKPKIILLDDPLRNLNKETKKEIIRLIKKLKEHAGTCFIMTTTNITDAIHLSDEVFLMKDRPGQIIGNIKIDENLISGLDHNYISSVKHKIESAYSTYEGTHLMSEIK